MLELLLVLLAATLATLANPYGWGLHAQLGKIMFSSQVRDLIDEWRAPDFQAPDGRPLEVLLLLCIVLLAIARRQPSLFSLLHLVLWIYFALGAVRQVSFLGIVAAAVLADLTCDLWPGLRDRLGLGRWRDWFSEFGRRASDWAATERAARWPVWSVAASALLVLATALKMTIPAVGIGTARLSPERWPIAAVDRLNAEADGGSLFHDLNWGGYLILNARPRSVFADDRFELYGRAFLLKYQDSLAAGPSWPELQTKHEFAHVLIPPNTPLARFLRESRDWETIFEDQTALLLRRRRGK